MGGVARIVVLGDAGSGKSSMCFRATSLTNPIPEILPSTTGLTKVAIGDALFELYDTESFYPSRGTFYSKIEQECEEIAKNALSKSDAVLLVHDRSSKTAQKNIEDFWLPFITSISPKARVLIAGNKIDKCTYDDSDEFQEFIGKVMEKHPNLFVAVDCSARTGERVKDLLMICYQLVANPVAPLYDAEHNKLKKRCMDAILDIFDRSDIDRDGVLSDDEMKQLQLYVYGAPLEDDELQAIKDRISIQEDGVTSKGVTSNGFVFLQTAFIRGARPEVVWQLLRKFGYIDDTFHCYDTKASPRQLPQVASKLQRTDESEEAISDDSQHIVQEATQLTEHVVEHKRQNAVFQNLKMYGAGIAAGVIAAVGLGLHAKYG